MHNMQIENEVNFKCPLNYWCDSFIKVFILLVFAKCLRNMFLLDFYWPYSLTLRLNRHNVPLKLSISTLSEVLHIDLQPNATLAIFGVTDKRHFTIRKGHKNIIAFTTLLARRGTLLHWKSKNPPNVSLWLRDLMQFIELEKIKYTLRGSRAKFFSIWDPVLTYLHKLKTMPT